MNNKEIDEAFRGIGILVEQYLSKKYPDAADPDDYIQSIETIIKAYRKEES